MNVIELNNVTMEFNLSKERVDNLKEYTIKRLKKTYKKDLFIAIRNVSFSIKKGESFAILGSNGSGKSTILKIISGIYKATKGNVLVNGTIAPMIELGAGFDLELTARENVYLNGAVLGYSREFMNKNFNEIIDFAELWDFIDVPVKNLSSGMQARLGFSIATIVEPDILIVDEILSVGDAHFQEKCEKKLADMIARGTTLVLVSHSIEQVLKVCNRAVWINKGELMKIGDVNVVCEEYIKNKDL